MPVLGARPSHSGDLTSEIRNFVLGYTGVVLVEDDLRRVGRAAPSFVFLDQGLTQLLPILEVDQAHPNLSISMTIMNTS